MFLKYSMLVVMLGVGLVASAVDELKILTIGNSFAESAFVYLPKVAESAGCKLLMVGANLGGCPLEKHWNLVEENEKDPAKKAYKYKNVKYSLKELLAKEKWDFVTVQQVSTQSWKPETYEPYLTNLIEYIHQYAPSAEVVIQQTWAYRFDNGSYKQWHITPSEMYEKITDAYRKVAEKHGLRVIPTGYAVQLGREQQTVKYQPCDPSTLKGLNYPDPLPQESGTWSLGPKWWKEKDGSHTLRIDSKHLNLRGSYLQACVWFAFLFNRPVSEVKFVPEVVDPADAQFIHKIAQEAVDTYEQIKKP